MLEILKVIQQERNDETNIDRQLLLKKIIQESFVELGLKRKVTGKDCHEHDLQIYIGRFDSLHFLSKIFFCYVIPKRIFL